MVARIASFVRKGRPTFGLVLDDNGLIDLGDPPHEGISSLAQALAAGQLEAMVARAVGREADTALSEVELLPVVPAPAKIFCVGANFPSASKPQTAKTPYPVIFTRFRDTLAAHGSPLAVPDRDQTLDFEGEVAVIVGRGGRNILQAEALAHIAGFTCFNDATVRSFQAHSHQFAPAKNFPATAVVGPTMVMASDIENHLDLRITTRLNGTIVQDATLRDMIFSVAEIIAYCSSFTPLAPGDIIACGSPDGFGASRNPPLYLLPGDRIEVEVPPIGILANAVVGGLSRA